MTQPGFPGTLPVYHLDPTAQEFFPTAPPPPPPPQIYYSYPPPPPAQPFPPPPAFVAAAADPPSASAAPSRTLLLSMVPPSVSESTVRRELEVFGDVRSVQMERRREGLVTVHFYDVRAAQDALAAIQEQHMQQQFRLGRHYDAVINNAMFVAPPPPLPPQTARGLISGRVVWAQFVTPVTSGLPGGNNQGTLVIFNLGPTVSTSSLKAIFERFGSVKEMRETPMKRHQRFVEFYDVRDAAAAMAAMNNPNNQILGRNAVVEFSRPGGLWKKFLKSPPQTQNGAGATSRNLNPNLNPSRNSSFSRCLPPPQPPTYTARPPTVEVKPPPLPPPPRWRSGNPSGSDGSSSGSSLHESVTNLCISEGSVNNNRRHKKMNSSENSNTSTAARWKGCGGGGRRGKEHDPRFLINEDAIVESNCRDSRTTVMIKNIPNKYSQKLLLNMLDNHCIHCNEQMNGGDDLPLSSYDFVYLPIDFINKCNVGYGFVNMTSPEATLRLYKAFHSQSWEVFNSRKICQVTYARLQGLDALREHFKNSKFPSEAEEYMPVVFSPPRDGQVLTDPAPITGGSSSVASSKENDESDEGGLNVNIENSIYDDGGSGGCSYEEETDM